MHILLKSNIVQYISDTEWECRLNAKGMSLSEYWPWVESVTTDGVADYSGETGYTIVECIDENIQERLVQLDEYIGKIPTVYNIKWSDSKVSATVGEETIQTHFSGDDTAKDARVLADKWTNVRRDRDRKLAETDFHALSDGTLADNMKTYRQALRDVPEDNADPDSISWPTKP